MTDSTNNTQQAEQIELRSVPVAKVFFLGEHLAMRVLVDRNSFLPAHDGLVAVVNLETAIVHFFLPETMVSKPVSARMVVDSPD